MTKIVIKAVENGPNLVTIDSETKAALCRVEHQIKNHTVMGLIQKLDLKHQRLKLAFLRDYSYFNKI